METTVFQRVNRVLSYTNLSKSEFARKIGMEQSTANSQLIGRRGVSLELVSKIAKNIPEISSDWLLNGDGEMLENEKYMSGEKAECDNVGKKIKALMRERKSTPNDLAKKLGLSTADVNSMITNDNVTNAALAKIAEIYEVPLSFFSIPKRKICYLLRPMIVILSILPMWTPRSGL
jgi:transcriptional regulator with XRE-family HTH domain